MIVIIFLLGVLFYLCKECALVCPWTCLSFNGWEQFCRELPSFRTLYYAWQFSLETTHQILSFSWFSHHLLLVFKWTTLHLQLRFHHFPHLSTSLLPIPHHPQLILRTWGCLYKEHMTHLIPVIWIGFGQGPFLDIGIMMKNRSYLLPVYLLSLLHPLSCRILDITCI